MLFFCSITAATASTGKKTRRPIVILLACKAFTQGVSWQRQDEKAKRSAFSLRCSAAATSGIVSSVPHLSAMRAAKA